MTAKRYFVTCEVGDCICELISRKLSDDEFEHLTYQNITDRLNQLTKENEQLKTFLESMKEELSLADRDNTALISENEQLKAHNQYLFKLLEDNGVIIELMKGDVE